MAVPAALTEDQIYHRCPPEKLDFDTTDALEDLELPFGQDRVLRALEFGARMAASGFNPFVLGIFVEEVNLLRTAGYGFAR